LRYRLAWLGRRCGRGAGHRASVSTVAL
jgi:hypothetical protein